MISMLLGAFTLSLVAAVTVVVGVGATKVIRHQQQLRLKELEVRALEAKADLPQVDPELPAFVDGADAASMDAWNKAQAELDHP